MRITLFILSDPQIYPPTVHAANILADRGHEVTLVGVKYKNVEPITVNERVKVHYVGKHCTGIRNVLQFMWSYLWLLSHVLRRKTDWIIAYDMMAVGPVDFVSRITNVKWGYHNHDYGSSAQGWYKIVKQLELSAGKRADFVSFPQEDRAERYVKEGHLIKTPIIIYNGPRRGWCENIARPHELILKLKEAGKKIILYQGQFSKYFNIDKLILSLTFLPENYVLCLRGRPLEENIVESYTSLAIENNIADRILFLPPMLHNQLPTITKFCDIGVAKLASDKNIPLNDYFLTGASNKISEYLACGLPVLMSNTEVNLAFYSKYEFAIFTEGNNPSNIAQVIYSTLEDGSKINLLRSSAKKEATQTFNYDVQFQKIVDLIEA